MQQKFTVIENFCSQRTQTRRSWHMNWCGRVVARLYIGKGNVRMDDCCAVPPSTSESPLLCPECKQKGKAVGMITLKALLVPSALKTLDPSSAYRFCQNELCEVVYFSEHHKFMTWDVKVTVFQKDGRADVSVCYCFGWTRERIRQAVRDKNDPSEEIRQQVQANRCGCEVNNPQGSCCLGNVNEYVRCVGAPI